MMSSVWSKTTLIRKIEGGAKVGPLLQKKGLFSFGLDTTYAYFPAKISSDRSCVMFQTLKFWL